MELFSLLRQVGAKAGSFALLRSDSGDRCCTLLTCSSQENAIQIQCGEHSNRLPQLLLLWIQHCVLLRADFP